MFPFVSERGGARVADMMGPPHSSFVSMMVTSATSGTGRCEGGHAALRVAMYSLVCTLQRAPRIDTNVLAYRGHIDRRRRRTGRIHVRLRPWRVVHDQRSCGVRQLPRHAGPL